MPAAMYNIALSNGQTLSVWQASNQAVNTNPYCTLDGAASVNTATTDFSPRGDCMVTDCVVDAGLTAGGFEFYNIQRGTRSGQGINNLGAYTSSNTTRRPPSIRLRGGQMYRLIQTVQGSA